MTTISNHETERRKLVAKLQGRITDVIGEFVSDGPDGITYVECLKALYEAMGRIVAELVHDGWRA